jgi:hypothetical protein
LTSVSLRHYNRGNRIAEEKEGPVSSCPACKVDNPAGSKFCAGCGAPQPKTPVPLRCAACGAESPEGSKFCKGCGRPAGGPPVQQQGPTGTQPPGGGAPGAGPKAPSQGLQRIKGLLGAGAGLYAVGIFLMFSELEKIKAAYGPYASQVPGTGMQWFLLILDAALAGLNLYAIALVTKGQFKHAKWLCAAMVALGAIFLVKGLSGPIQNILINAGLIVAGVYGWILVSREERGPAL